MPLQLVFSNRVEPLVDSLSASLAELWRDFAHPPEVVVPTPAVAKWLKLRLCLTRPALVGLPTPTLESFLWRALAPGPGDRLLRASALAQALVPHLGRDALDGEERAAMRTFLLRDGEVDPTRRMQLAHELARLFLEYEYNRPSVWSEGRWKFAGLDRAWPEAPWFQPDGADGTETWQRELFGRVFAADGLLQTQGWITLPRLHRRRREEGWTPAGGPVLLFLVDRVSHFHRNLLMELAAGGRDVHPEGGREVQLFLLNPCAEFWEDVDTRSRGRSSSTRGRNALRRFQPGDYQRESLPESCYPADDSAAPDPLLLRRWGHTARENIMLWCQATDYDFAFQVDPPAPSVEHAAVLPVLQQALLQRHPGPAVSPIELPDGRMLDGPLADDGSVRVLACPERGREMEAVRDALFQWLAEEPDRSPSDAVVYLPDPARHRAEIHRVFGGLQPADPGYVPWTILGESGRESAYARGVEALLALALDGMNRPRVFALLRNPLCRARLDLAPEIIPLWEEWAEGTGMIRGWDARDRAALFGDAEPLDHHTFRAGILRGYAARLAEGELELPLASGSGQVRLPGWRDFESADPAAFELFAAALERLHADLAELRGSCDGRASATPAGLGERLLALCDAWLDPGDGVESLVRREFAQGIAQFALQDGRLEPMHLPELADAARSVLPDELPGSFGAFAGSLTFAPLRIGQILPHRFVAVAGLEADAFPRPARRTSLDLLGRRRIVGDADLGHDDRHAFLAAVLAARERLVLSWKAEDPQKDREIEPSSVLHELEEALTGILGPPPKGAEGAGSLARRRVPLLARERPATGGPVPPWEVASWDPADAAAPGEPDPGPPWLRGPDGDGMDRPRVSLAEVRAFASDSFAYRLKRVQGMGDEESPDTLGSSDEALESSGLAMAGLRRRLFPRLCQAVWAAGADARSGQDRNGAEPFPGAAEALRLHERFLWESASPEGELAIAERAALHEWGAGAARALAGLRAVRPAHALATSVDASLGVAGRPPSARLGLADGREIEVVGQIPAALVPRDPVGEVILLGLGRVDRGAVDPGAQLDLWLQAAFARAAGWTGAIRLAWVSRGMPSKPADPAAWLAEEDASSVPGGWLLDLVEDLLAGAGEFLPSNHILSVRNVDLETVREAVESSEYPDELERLLRPDLPGEARDDAGELARLARRRLGPLLRASVEGRDD